MRPGRLTAIGGITLAVGAYAWFAASLFVPFAHEKSPVEYLLVGAPWRVFAASALAAAALLWLLVHRLRVTARALAPLACLGLAPLAALSLVRGVDDRLSVLTYVLVDLRWWWTALVIALVVIRIDREAGSPIGTRFDAWWRLAPRRLLVLDASLLVLVVAAAVITNRSLRFTAVLHGDEVKYLRYCENFYQGLGLEVEHQRTIDELTPGYRPRVGRNFTLAARALREEMSNIAADARAYAAAPRAFRWNRARYAEEWFIRGKNGGFYQVHNPGFAFVLFPAYYVDRRFISTTPGYQGRLPGELPVTNALCLAIWATWAVVVFRFLRGRVGSDALAWTLAAAAMLAMPVAAFPFQMYPEAAAGLILFGVGGALLAPAPRGRAAALVMGLASGLLPWLHVRYLILAAVLLAWGLWSLGRRRVPFAAGFLLLLGAMSLYAYHLTGSFLPDAMYETEGSYSPWRLRDGLQAVIAYPFDRVWGLFAHAPLYLLALPGVVVAARRQPRALLLSALLFVALAGPSAGHGFSAAGATPLRHLVAVIPFLMLPVAWTLRTWGHLRPVRAVSVMGFVLSLYTAAAYDLHHTKDVGRFVDWGTSGWAANLLMPWTHAAPWERSWGNFAVLLSWAVTALLLLALPLRRGVEPAPERHDLTIPYALAAVAAFVCLATALTAAGPEWTRADYFIPPVEARAAAIRYAGPLERCALCYSSLRGEVGRGELVGNTIESFFVFTSGETISGAPIVFTARVAAREGAGWGALAIDFGDGEVTRLPSLFGHAEVSHIYAKPGAYRVVATFAPGRGSVLRRELDVSVLR